jgi:phage minor structural protein GP20|nr:MAG TPA: minor structural protein [Caudoviricetes sp.]
MAFTRDSLKQFGITDDEVITKILNAHHAELDPVKDKADQYDKVKADFDEQAKNIKSLQDAAGDKEALQKQIDELKAAAETKAADHKKELEEMQNKLESAEFDKLLDDAISKAGGRRTASIRAELKLDELRASKDRSSDIEAAINALKEAEDTSFLFGSNASPTGAKVSTSGNASGGVGGTDEATATARAVMGLSTKGKEN